MRTSVFQTSLPVAFGYVPLGMAFGVLLVGLGYAWWWAPVMSLVIYAGSAQFLAVSLLATGAGVMDAFVATLLLNLRHVFYGLTMSDRYRSLGRGRSYAVFGLTDETFSVLSASDPQRDRPMVLGVTALNQGWWVLGSGLGALVGRSLPLNTQGLGFALTALFAVLLIEQLRRPFRWTPLVGSGAGAVLCLVFLPGKYFLLGAITLAALVLVVVPDRGGKA